MYLTIENRKIYLNVWDHVKNPKGIIQVIHGMAEHSDRYIKLGAFFNLRGYIVVCNDHFGHRNSINNYYGEMTNEGLYTYVSDEMFISEYLNKKYEMPIHIISHSMGSFIGQELLSKNINYIKSYTFIGSAYSRSFKMKVSLHLLRILSKFRNKKSDYLLDKLFFLGYSNLFEKRTAFDWLSLNRGNVDTYINDENCGNIYPSEFYKKFGIFLNNLHIPNKFKDIINKKSLLILSGSNDPVGNFSKDILKLEKFYKNLNFSVQSKIYKNLRHEILNEENFLEIYKDIYTFISQNSLYEN